MTVKLSSLRISAEMDADGFTAGATAIEQSSSRAGAAVKGLGESIQQTDVKIGRSGDGVRETFTVRKISFQVGVERTFPVHSPVIDHIEVVTRGDVRRAKLYYLRNLRGKKAKIKEKRG